MGTVTSGTVTVDVDVHDTFLAILTPSTVM
jgi:hypothetical protein